MLNSPSLPAVNSLNDVQRNFEELRTFFNQLTGIFAGMTPAGTGNYILTVDADGNIQTYKLIAGSGTTITVNTALRTWTITAP